MTTDDLTTRFRAHREQEKHDEAMTEEQVESRRKRRAILGSLDETYALNRYERDRGAASVLVVGVALAVAGFWLSSRLQPWQVLGLLALAAYAFGCWFFIRGARQCSATRDALDAKAPRGQR